MFITKTRYEKEIKKAEKRGENREREKNERINSIDGLNQNMWNQFDRVNIMIDKIVDRLDKIESKSKHNKIK